MVLGERRPRTIVGATAALSLSILLGGCTDGSAGTPIPTVSASEAPSAEPSSAAPEPTTPAPSAEVEKPAPPEAMRRDDVAGAEAAAQYFLELYQYAYSSGDVSALEGLSHPECVFCADALADVKSLYESGGHATGGIVEISEVSALPPVEPGAPFRVNVTASEGPSERIERTGERTQATGGTSVLIFALLPTSEGWRVRGVDIGDVVR